MAKLNAQNGRLNFVQPAVPSWFHAVVTRGLAVGSQSAQPRVRFRCIGDDHASVAVPAQILRWIKTDTSQIAERSGRLAFVSCAKGLRVVLDDRQAVAFGDFAKGIHICGKAIKMNDNDRASARRDAFFDFVGTQVEGVWVDIGEYWCGPKRADRTSGGDKGEWRQDDFIASGHA